MRHAFFLLVFSTLLFSEMKGSVEPDSLKNKIETYSWADSTKTETFKVEKNDSLKSVSKHNYRKKKREARKQFNKAHPKDVQTIVLETLLPAILGVIVTLLSRI